MGLETEEVQVNDLLLRAKAIFENEDVPLSDKQELSEQIYTMYLDIKNNIKNRSTL